MASGHCDRGRETKADVGELKEGNVLFNDALNTFFKFT